SPSTLKLLKLPQLSIGRRESPSQLSSKLVVTCRQSPPQLSSPSFSSKLEKLAVDLLCYPSTAQMESQPEDTSQPSVGESNNVTESNIEIEMSKDIPDKIEIEETFEDNSKRKRKSEAWNHFKRVKVEVIGYFIDDNWTLQNCILRFSYVPPPHTTEVLADTLVEALMDWNIDCKVSTITVDKLHNK
ncbi:UNVERIFIED_CONTAM: hypothetical protein Sradi_6078100, partial [Sesamum radiatum]